MDYGTDLRTLNFGTRRTSRALAVGAQWSVAPMTSSGFHSLTPLMPDSSNIKGRDTSPERSIRSRQRFLHLVPPPPSTRSRDSGTCRRRTRRPMKSSLMSPRLRRRSLLAQLMAWRNLRAGSYGDWFPKVSEKEIMRLRLGRSRRLR